LTVLLLIDATMMVSFAVKSHHVIGKRAGSNRAGDVKASKLKLSNYTDAFFVDPA
jgi:hypothetical protein